MRKVLINALKSVIGQDFELNDVSESHGISMTADVMFGLISTPELEELGHMRIKILKNRFGQNGGSYVIGVNRSKMKLYDIDGIGNAPQPSTPSLGSRQQPSNKPAMKF